MSFTSDEVNYLIYRYLQESGRIFSNSLLCFLYCFYLIGLFINKFIQDSFIQHMYSV